jgi:hypothetical protein
MIDFKETIIQRCVVIGARNMEIWRDKKDGKVDMLERKTASLDREIRELGEIFRLQRLGE